MVLLSDDVIDEQIFVWREGYGEKTLVTELLFQELFVFVWTGFDYSGEDIEDCVSDVSFTFGYGFFVIHEFDNFFGELLASQWVP